MVKKSPREEREQRIRQLESVEKERGNAVEALQQKGGKLDLIMPGMAAARPLTEFAKAGPEYRFCYAAAIAVNGQADEIMKRGCNGFIQKPFNISGLSRKVKPIMDEDQGESPD